MFDQLKNLKQLTGLLGNMGDLREKFERMQEELKTRTVDAEAGAGAVRVTVNGKMELVELRIDPAMVATLAGTGSDADRAMVEELIASAVNAAMAKAQDMLKASFAEMAGGMNLPGMDQLGNLPGMDGLIGGKP